MLALGYKGPVLWSTSHGRYGRPLRLAGGAAPGADHARRCEWAKPAAATAPPILVATAPYSTPVRDGQMVGDGDPRTTIAFALYAQVPQADGSTFRNIMLDHVGTAATARRPSGARALGEFTQAGVTAALDALALPRDAALSVVAIEFLPAGGVAEPQLAPLHRNPVGRHRCRRSTIR